MRVIERMEKDGWVFGFEKHGGLKYWSFRKEDIEIDEKDIRRIDKEFDKPSRNFTPWEKEEKE